MTTGVFGKIVWR